MPRFSDDTIERIKTINIGEVFAPSVNLKKQGKVFMGLCPFHEEKTPSLSVDPIKGFYYCFGCQTSGNAITAYMFLNKVNFTDAVKGLANSYNINVEYEQNYQSTGTPKKNTKQSKNKKIDIAFNKNLEVDSREECLTFAQVPYPVQKELPEGTESVMMTIYYYSEFQQIRRYEWEDKSKPKGRDKTFRPFSFNEKKGEWIIDKGEHEWRAYKINDVCKNSGKWILGAEGEKCAESLIRKGFYTLTWSGVGSNKEFITNTFLNLKQSGVQGLIYFADNDQPGMNKAKKIKEYGAEHDFEVVIIDIKDIWTDCTTGGDIADYLSLNPDLSGQDLMGIIIKQTEKVVKDQVSIKQEFEVKSQSKSSDTDLYDQVKEIFLSDLLESRKIAAGKKLGFTKKELTEYFTLIDNELNNQSEKKELISNFSDMSNVRKQDIDLHRYLYGDNGKLAEALKIIGKGALVPQINFFITLLSAAAPFIGKKSKVIISNKTKFIQPCVFWTAIVGESGTNKSFPQQLIFSTLEEMENKAYKEYMKEKQEYDKLVRSDAENIGERPIRKRFLSKDATVATLETILSTCGGSLTYWKDELSGLVATRNRSGNGGDVQYELQEWNGGSIITDRADEKRQICIPRVSVSRTGTIQFGVLEDIAGDFKDTNGWLARWLFSVVESGKGSLNITDDDDEDTGIDDILRQLFTKLQYLPDNDYLLSTGAKQSFKKWFDFLGTEAEKQSLEGLKLAYAKIQAYTARLALWLHCVNAVLADKNPDASISKETMNLAIELGGFFLKQVKFIHNAHSPNSGLLGDALRVYEYIKGRSDGVTASNIKANRFNNKNKKDIRTEHIKAMCQDLINSGHIVESDGRYFDNSNQKIDKDINRIKQPINNGFSDLEDQEVDKIDKKLIDTSTVSNTDDVRLTDFETEKIDKLIHEGVHSTDSHSVDEGGDRALDVCRFKINDTVYLRNKWCGEFVLITGRRILYPRSGKIIQYECVNDDNYLGWQNEIDLYSLEDIDNRKIIIEDEA